MKVYLVFKLKDPTKKSKKFIVDSIHTSKEGAYVRQRRIHGFKSASHMLTYLLKTATNKRNKSNSLETEFQTTYIINKSLKGLITNA